MWKKKKGVKKCTLCALYPLCNGYTNICVVRVQIYLNVGFVKILLIKHKFYANIFILCTYCFLFSPSDETNFSIPTKSYSQKKKKRKMKKNTASWFWYLQDLEFGTKTIKLLLKWRNYYCFFLHTKYLLIIPIIKLN